jgi:peptide/nickel transport system ATP-binding protein
VTLLAVNDLSVTIDGTPILDSVAVRLDGGEILGLAGESGSGKTMTALAIAGLLPPRAALSGSIRLDGESLAGADDRTYCNIRGRDIGIVFQEPMTALNPLMTIGAQVAETVRLHRDVSRREARQLAGETLERVGLPASRFPLDSYPHSLSGGQRQRVAIAMAIVLKPKLLIADEPTTALDVTTQAGILRLFRRLVREDGIGLILVSHDLAVIAETADRLAVMQAGRIVDHGPVAEVLQASQEPYTRTLLENTVHVPERAAERRIGREPVLETRGVVREYAGPRRLLGTGAPFRAVDGVSLQVFARENVGLVGESGCGKSTLLRTILGLDRAQAGEIRVFGQSFPTADRIEMLRLRRRIQVVFQDPFGTFDPRWRVRQLLAENFHLYESPLTRAEATGKVHRILERVGLASADAERFPHEFSGGQRQRIAIARALITEPAIIALDEAVSALDVSIRARILDLLAELSDRLGTSWLFVTHDLSVVRSIADRVLVMKDGRIVEEGATEDVFANPVHPYTIELLKAVPDLKRTLAEASEPVTTES